MKRVYIAAGIFLLCLALSLFSFYCITGECAALRATAEQIDALAQADDESQLSAQCDALQKRWQRDTLPFSLLTTHVHYDTLEESVDKLCFACRQNDKAQIRKACEELIFEANHIILSIQPKWENVF